MPRFLSWFLVFILFGGFAVVAILTLRAEVQAGKGMPAYSVYSEERDGLAESARLLGKLGWEPVAVTRPIQFTHYRGLLILVEPEGSSMLPGQGGEISDADARALLQWVEQGNTLLLGGNHMNAVHRDLDVEISGDAAAAEAGTVTRASIDEAGAYTDDLDTLIVEGNDTIKASGALPLWWVGDRPGAVLLRSGRGRVVVVADPSFLTRRGLLRKDGIRYADNLVFLANLAALHAREGQVYFDEYHHGLHSGGGFWGYLRYHKQQWLVLEVLLLAVVGLWAVAVRLGPAVPMPQELRADAVDYASAVARIYERAGVRRLLGQVLVRDFLAALTRHLRLRRGTLPVEILAAWRRHYPKEEQGGLASAGPAERLPALLRGVAELRKGDITERKLLAWARAFDQFKLEVLRAP